MKFLLLEDNLRKRDDILALLRRVFPEASVKEAESVHSGVMAMDEDVDLILLDMTMPPFDPGPGEDGAIRHFGGREFLRQLEARELLRPVIVVSQFAQFGDGPTATTLTALGRELEQQYPDWYVGAVQFSGKGEEWRDELIRAMRRALARKGER